MNVMVERPDVGTGDVARHFGISERTVLRLVAQGMPHYRLGDRTIRFRLDEVIEWARRSASERAAAPASV